MRTAAIVVNPISGSASRRRALAEFCDTLRAGGMEARVRETSAPGDGAAIAKEEAARGTQVVVAAGGDGTVNDVARGLTEHGPDAPALAILPRGTRPSKARSLDLAASTFSSTTPVLACTRPRGGPRWPPSAICSS